MTALAKAGKGSPVLAADINVRFQDGPNAAGIDQPKCTCCGDCVSGCNVGAKNTLLMNYLPDAVKHGTKVFTEMDVDHIEKLKDGWLVWVRPLTEGCDGSAAPRPLRCNQVVVAAGSLGSTAILLRSQLKGTVALSDKLGEHFTANGDVLAFAVHTDMNIDGVGEGPDESDPKDVPGPCITAIIDARHEPPSRNPTIIEDAVIPGALARVVPLVLAGESVARWERHLRRGKGPRRGFLSSILRRGPHGSVGEDTDLPDDGS